MFEMHGCDEYKASDDDDDDDDDDADDDDVDGDVLTSSIKL